jgi:MYXO-CTERM domain-containing protein
MSLRHTPFITSLACSSIAALAVLGYTADARADNLDLDACGGIWLTAEGAGSCEVVPKMTCEQRCEPATVERVCASRLYEQCAPQCDVSIETECSTECEQSCADQCTSTSTIECSAFCMTDCQATVSETCNGDAAHGECGSSGSACCSAHCEAGCTATNETECMPVCSTACESSCGGRANVDCQVECQQAEYTTCSDQVVQECHDECNTTGAAIFCDGNFLATGGDLAACADQLNANFGISLDVDIDVDVDITDGDDGDSGDADEDDDNDLKDKLSCSVDPGSTAPLGMLALFVIAGWRVRRAARR